MASNPRAARRTNAALVLITACCGVFVGFGSVLVFTFGVFLKPLSNTFGWTRGQISLAFAVAALSVAICSPFIGHLLDRFPARRIILPCTAIYGTGFASLSLLTPHMWHLFGAFIALGIIGNGTTQLGYARVVSAWFDQARGRALAAVMCGSGAGSMVFPPVAQALISTYGWRVAYAILGGFILLLALPLAALFLYEPEESVKPRGETPTLRERGVWADIRSFRFLGLISGLLLFSVATNGLIAHMPALLTDRGFASVSAASVVSIVGLASLASRFATGHLLDRFSAPRVVTLLFIVCAAGFLLVNYGTGLWILYTGGLLIGAGLGAEPDATPYLLTRYFGLARFGQLYAYTWSAYAFAAAFGPYFMGRMFDRTGSYASAMLVCCGIVLASAALFALLPREKKAG